MSAAASVSDRWFVIGASGLLGHGLCRYLAGRGADVVATVNAHPVGISGVQEVTWTAARTPSAGDLVESVNAAAVFYSAGLTSVDRCEMDEASADLLHAEVPAMLASATAKAGGRFIYVSTDHLWDGSKPLVTEDEPLNPINAYARSKAKGEAMVAAADPSALILRTNFFGHGRPWRASLSDWMIDRLRSGNTLNAFTDAYFSPIAVPLLCKAIEDAVRAGLSGVFHACGRQRLSKHEFALRLARWCGLPEDRIRAGRLADADLLAPRPADMSLSTQKLSSALGAAMPDVAESFAAMFEAEAEKMPERAIWRDGQDD